MSTQHTPGPWRYDYEPGYCGEIIASNGKEVATFTDEPNAPDARLIAAAPDLLDAAKLVLAWYEAENDFTKEPDFYKRIEMCRVSEVALRAAIAKATGGEA